MGGWLLEVGKLNKKIHNLYCTGVRMTPLNKSISQRFPHFPFYGKPVNPKGNQPWIFIGRTDAEAEAPILWPPDVKNWLLGKESDAGKDWRQEEKGMTENEIAGWHHQLSGHEFEQTPGDGEEQGSLACCSPWRHKSQTWLSSWTARLQEAWGYVLMVIK